MKRRALLVTVALCAIVCAMASGAWAADKPYIVKIDFEPGNVDTANHVGLDVADKVNDSLIFYSREFGIPSDWTAGLIRLLVVTQDGLIAADTMGLALESKTSDANDSLWFTNKVMTKIAEGTFNTVAGASVRCYNDADSTVGDLYRFKIAIIAEEDTLRAHDVSGVLPFTSKYRIYGIFRQRGNE